MSVRTCDVVHDLAVWVAAAAGELPADVTAAGQHLHRGDQRAVVAVTSVLSTMLAGGYDDRTELARKVVAKHGEPEEFVRGYEVMLAFLADPDDPELRDRADEELGGIAAGSWLLDLFFALCAFEGERTGRPVADVVYDTAAAADRCGALPADAPSSD